MHAAREKKLGNILLTERSQTQQVTHYVSLFRQNAKNKGVRRRQWHPTPVLLPGKSHGWRSLVGCSPWGRWELDMTQWLHFHFLLSCIGEGNGNPLQCSCLENPRDGGAWWAAVYGVAQSRTQLKWLSSSSREQDRYGSCTCRIISKRRQLLKNNYTIRGKGQC